MSYILDAIKKAEHEQNIYQAVDYEIKTTNNQPIFLGLSLIVLLILLAVIF
jgi:hypothetical protein